MSLILATEVLVRNDARRMQCLQAVGSLGLDDCYIAAGFLRNLIWDHLHDYAEPTALNDVDVVFFNRSQTTPEHEHAAERALSLKMPAEKWQVRNQARMHLSNGHQPYLDAADAIGHYPELATCVGVQLTEDDRVQIVAPHGLAHNWSLQVQVNPKPGYPQSLYSERMRSKCWNRHWPKLQVTYA